MNAQRLTLTAAVIFMLMITAQIQSVAAESSVETEADQLAKEVDDPTAILTQLKFQDLYTPQNYLTTAQTNTIQVRSVVPIQPLTFLPWQQIVRSTPARVSLAEQLWSAWREANRSIKGDNRPFSSSLPITNRTRPRAQRQSKQTTVAQKRLAWTAEVTL